MGCFVYREKKYKVDSQGFLKNPADWDEDFAVGMAPRLKIPDGLTEDHWKVIYFIRNTFEIMNKCPLVYVACKENRLGLGNLKQLFPTGYLRGACKLAGVTYRDVFIQKYWLEGNIEHIEFIYDNKMYKTDVHGFLLNCNDWDENYAISKAYEMKMPEYLTREHWDIIYYIREVYKETNEIPTVYKTCEENKIDLVELERLFPDGYHRGAVKIAGLRYLGENWILTDKTNFKSGEHMATFTCKDKTYEVDSGGFLINFNRWDKDFAEGMAPQMKIPLGLTKEHWDVINFIRDTFRETGRCPLVYETCRMNGLRRKELKKLFPTGYLRGACKLSGITYREGYLGQAYLPTTAEDLNVISVEKTYRVDVRGFLVNPDDWDEYYAVYRAYDMKIPGGKLAEKHWQVIRFLRDRFKKDRIVPTVYETCEENQIDLEELQKLFPDGYHRGAVKIAGLRVR